MQYSQQVKDYFNDHSRAGDLADATLRLHAKDERLDYDVRLALIIDANRVRCARFLVCGDPNVIASLAWFCEYLEDRVISKEDELDAMVVAEILEIDLSKLYAAILIQHFYHDLKEHVK